MKKDIKEYLYDREFYELMQIYRHTPLVYPAMVVKAFEDVKSYIIKMVEEMNKPEPKTDIVLYSYANNYENGEMSCICNACSFDYLNEMHIKPNIKLTYDGETKELKSAEKI